jgi:CheY-like chemotaxis protein
MGIEPVPVAINLSGRQFEQSGLDALIRGILIETGVEPRWIQLEITESMLMRNPDAAITVLKNLKALGIHISVDDFGTGYSSLSYLKRFPLDALKVDRSFVQDIPADTDDTAIARAVITMAHSLNLKVIAEGVETREQVKFLRHNRCDEGQGYLFSKPIPAHECTTWLAGSRRSEKVVPAGDAVTVPAVLLVDDDPDCLTLTRHLLEPDGYRILMASDAAQALEQLALDDVSVIVSDENMPGMHGVELLSRVKTMYPHVARIMMTGETDFQTAAKAINEGEVFKFFVKHRDDHLLRNEVRRAFWSRDGVGDYHPFGAGVAREQGAQVSSVVRMLARRTGTGS